ncbi:uncharacterized protein LOC105848331 isoform X2 [Hydra vulgaris]|uniref:Membrane-anchored junction protein n=1 Tax=Hydra vulgaris TaxID=6087 RepID=A0A6M6CC30_HYDVU|nr:membrane-anchored junction protein [Hydra vulgaris]
MTCSLSDFKLPDPDVRLVMFGDTVYKVKLLFRSAQHNGIASDSHNIFNDDKVQYDIERVMKYVLYNPDRIDPIHTDDLVIYPYKKIWSNSKKLQFSKYDVKLSTSPYLFMFYIEKKVDSATEKSSKFQFSKVSEKDDGVEEPNRESNCNRELQIKSIDDQHGYVSSFLSYIKAPWKSIGKRFWLSS